MQQICLAGYLLQHMFDLMSMGFQVYKGFDMFPEYMPIWTDNQHQLCTPALGPVHTLKMKKFTE